MSQDRYDPKTIEPKWQRHWEQQRYYTASDYLSRPKFYCLEMFPYPSGRIHMGHVRVYAIGDVIARFKTMKGFNVLHPMGWDAFGLPAENAAIERGRHPSRWTQDNIAFMKEQLKKMGLSYDWDREITTCRPEYYRWNQWFFLKMYEKGLAYRKNSFVNWCPNCETVLANEQVIDGRCWRCDTRVSQKELPQWFFRITDYAEQLLSDCDKLQHWPERVLAMQRNWIGKSIGCEARFPLDDRSGEITIFTTRPDTLFGVTFMSLAPEHPILPTLLAGSPQKDKVHSFVEQHRHHGKAAQTEQLQEKEGVFTGVYARHPFTGERIPIWVANFVLMEYGTGAVMAVPAHDQRDFEFAKKYNLPIRVVIQNPEGTLQAETMEAAYVVEEGELIASGDFNRLRPTDAQEAIAGALEVKGLGKKTIQYRLRDWGISRQRYWGTPIPMIYCKDCGLVPVPESDLPVILPEDIPFTGKGGSPLLEHKAFRDVFCPKCKGSAHRETDTMDTFVDSSWYFFRYTAPQKNNGALDPKAADYWMPVEQYIGGIEHAVLHLLYARFFTKVIRDLGLTRVDEPFDRLLTQGMVIKESYSCPHHGYLFPEQVEMGDKERGPGARGQGPEKMNLENPKPETRPQASASLAPDPRPPAPRAHVYLCKLCKEESGRITQAEIGRVEKMSKRKKNVVDPGFLIDHYGADTSRLFSLFAAPPEKDLEWSDAGVEGSYRFLERVWRLVLDFAEPLRSAKTESIPVSLPPHLAGIRRKVHQTIAKVTQDIEGDFHFNTAIAALMELVNHLYGARNKLTLTTAEATQEIQETKIVIKEAVETLVRLLSPFSPHIAEELWERLGNPPSIVQIPWPTFDPVAAQEEEIEVVVQVNGKLRGRLSSPIGLSDEVLKDRALEDPRIKHFIGDRPIKKLIVVKGKLVNIVL